MKKFLAVLGLIGALALGAVPSAQAAVQVLPLGCGSASPKSGDNTTYVDSNGNLCVSAAATNVSASTVVATGSSASRALSGITSDVVSILTYGIVADGVTDQHAKLQALFDANPTATILFPRSSGCVISNGTIYLSDSTGRNFSGTIVGAGGCITFTNAGNATDSDIAAQRGFEALPKTNASAGDNTGILFVRIDGLTINGPAHGMGAHIANSYGTVIKNNTFTGSRWNVVTECVSNTTFEHNNFSSFVNAGVGMLYLGDTARVWYGATSNQINSYWNDSPTFKANSFGGSTVGGLAMIVDDGSNAEGVRAFESNTFISSGAAGIQYGYVARKANPQFITNNWFEAINYPIRLLSTNAVEGGSTFPLPGVTSAEPGGTYTLANFPDGYAFTATAIGNWFSGGINDIDVSGLEGNATIGGNISQGHSGYHITSSQGALNISDLGDTVIGGTGTYVNHPYATYSPLAGTAQAASPVFSGTASFTGVGGTVTLIPPSVANGNSSINFPGTGSVYIATNGSVISYGPSGFTAQAVGNPGALAITPPSAANQPVNIATYNTTGGIAISAVGGVNIIGGTLSAAALAETAYTSSSIGGSALGAGACASTTVSITGLTTAMIVDATPVTYPGDAYYWKAYASAAGTATVKVCAAIAGTPTASTYNLRVIQ